MHMSLALKVCMLLITSVKSNNYKSVLTRVLICFIALYLIDFAFIVNLFHFATYTWMFAWLDFIFEAPNIPNHKLLILQLVLNYSTYPTVTLTLNMNR